MLDSLFTGYFTSASLDQNIALQLLTRNKSRADPTRGGSANKLKQLTTCHLCKQRNFLSYVVFWEN